MMKLCNHDKGSCGGSVFLTMKQSLQDSWEECGAGKCESSSMCVKVAVCKVFEAAHEWCP